MWGTYPAIPGGDDESTEESECDNNAFSVVAGTDESEIYDAGKDVLRKTAAILGTSLPEPASRYLEKLSKLVNISILIVVTFILTRIRMMRKMKKTCWK